MKSKKAVILMSGGLDSSTLLAKLQQEGYEVHALSFNYHQRHEIELAKVKEFIKDYPCLQSHKIVKLDLSLFISSALINENVEVPKFNSSDDFPDDIPVTYVPARNTIFLSYALGYAETISAHEIFIGVHASDAANYPDCRPEFIEAFEQLATIATKVGTEEANIFVRAPLVHLTKAQIVEMGLRMNVNYAKTISCYDPDSYSASCGSCQACVTRLEAFAINKLKDPILYVN